MTWTREIDAIVSERHLLKHPFYTAWTEGRLSLHALRAYAAQYYKHVTAFPTYLSAIHSRTEDLATRQYLLENLIDEERGLDSHPELWLRFAEGLGVSRDEIRGTAPLPETTMCDTTYRSLAAGSPAAGLAALYAYESMVPAVSQSKIVGLAEHYGIDDPGTIRFFTVHLAVDGRHAAVARDLLLSVPADERPACLAATSSALDAIWGLLDGVALDACPEVLTSA